MKSFLIGALFFLLGLIIGVILCKYDVINWAFNFADIITVLATVIVSIVVIYIAKSFNNDDVARQFIIDDLNKLCNTYINIGKKIDKLHKKVSSENIVAINDEAKKRIQLLFGDGDLLIDQINEELKAVYGHSDDRYLRDASDEYYRFVTDGDLWSKSDYIVTLEYIKENNERLNNTISKIKKKAIDIIKKS